MSDTALVVMARYPTPGTTKTRLARALGDEATLQLYRAFLVDLADHFAGSDYDLHWTYTPAGVDYSAFIAALVPDLPRHTRSFAQQGTDFAARLLYAFQWTRQQGYASTIVIGSDAPHITRGLVDQAHIALREADVVLGPADDGGYYLIAMRTAHDVFSAIPMSTSVVLAQTVARASHLGLSVRLLPPLFDIDEYTDLLRLAALLREDSTRAPATAVQIASLRRIYDYDSIEHAGAAAGSHPAALDLS
ncbi:MAG: TIGR04282 family arsenosugar biosynthesis glycosyltransferase [Ktedonobacteraceae bacterium]